MRPIECNISARDNSYTLIVAVKSHQDNSKRLLTEYSNHHLQITRVILKDQEGFDARLSRNNMTKTHDITILTDTNN